MVGMVRVGLGQSIAALIIHLTSLLQVQSARFCSSLTLADSNVLFTQYRTVLLNTKEVLSIIADLYRSRFLRRKNGKVYS
jgi:hypothetical protein